MPNHVLQLDCTFADGDVERDLGSAYPGLWVEVDIAFDATYLASLLGQPFSAVLIKFFDSAFGSGRPDLEIWQQGGTHAVWTSFPSPGGSGFYNPASPVVALQAYRAKVHVVAGSPITYEIWIDGVSFGTIVTTGTNMSDVESLDLQATGVASVGGHVFFDNLIVGTTEGASDVYSDAFEGDLSGWNSFVSGSASIVVDPGIAPPSGPPPPPPPTPAVLRYGDPPLWRLIVTNRSGQVLTVLDKRSAQRGFVFALNQPATHSGLVPSDDPEINIPSPSADSPAFLSHNTRFIYGLRREVRPTLGTPPWHCRFAGIVMGLEDVAADTPTSRYTAYDPWQYLMSRPIRNNDGTRPGPDGITYINGRASDMALDLLANTVAVDGTVYIDASDHYLHEVTDVINGRTVFDRGISVGEAWQQLCDTGTIDIVLRPVYDPSRPGVLCELTLSKQAGGLRANAVMGWDRASRSMTDLSRLIDGTRLANRVQMYAGQGGRPVTLQSDAASITAYGEYWAQQFMVGKQTQGPLVELLALAQLQIRKRGAKSITFSPAPERSYLVLRDYGLGDYVPVWASRSFREPLGIDYASFDPAAPGGSGYQRLYAIPIELDDNGVERPGPLGTTNDSANSF